MILAGALILGGYTILGLNYYSILVSGTNTVWTRLALYIPAIALFVLAPMFGCMFLLGAGPNPPSPLARLLWLLAVFLCWSGTAWIYLIKNRRLLRTRLRGRNASNTASQI
jgi:hypothetical protein